MSFLEVLQRITAALDHAGILHAYWIVRQRLLRFSALSTQDIDLVIAAYPAQLRAFVEGLPRGEYYSDLDAALEAHKRESLFNIIDLKTGWKIDLIIRKARAFSQEEFGRRQLLSMQGVSLFVASAEDVILAKLEWSKLAQSQRQIEDAVGILKIREDSLDRLYLDRWVRELGLTKEWSDAQRIAKISGPNELDGSE